MLREAGGVVATLDQGDFDAAPFWRRSAIAAIDPTVFADWRAWLAARR